MAQGVSYEIDLTRPVGDRIQNLRLKGQLLLPDLKLRIAVNNYRYGGSAGYRMFRGAPILWRSYEDIRELIVQYYAVHQMPAAADENWRVVPASAQTVLREEVRGEASRPLTQ
jgi:2',3'-cyclic-nucleotide 2'-phosphodiesterase/3'-nucleotidase